MHYIEEDTNNMNRFSQENKINVAALRVLSLTSNLMFFQ